MADPYELPVPAPLSEVNFDLGYAQQVTSTGGGFTQVFDRRVPMWFAEFQTPELNQERDRLFQSFLDLLEGARNSFMAYDPRRMHPYAYRNYAVDEAVWGSPTVLSYSSVNGTITLQNGTVGAYVTMGDMIACKSGNMWLLFRSQTTGAFNGSGQITLTVRPRIPVAITPGTAIRYRRPGCAMKIFGGIQKKDSVFGIGPSYSFKAYQFLDRTV